MADPTMFPIVYEDRDYSTGVAKPTDANVEIYYKVDPGDQLLYSGLETFGINTTKPFKGKLVNGVLQKRSGGQMELVANVDLGLEKLIYTITFLNADVSGIPVPLQGFDFEAPTDDSELNLNSVAPVVAEQTTGYIQGPPTYAEKVDDGPPVLYQWKTAAGVNVGPPQEIDIVLPDGGDASTNTSTSVDGEAALFSGTGGKTLKRATGSGVAKLTSGVLGTATAGTDYAAPTSGSAILKGNGAGGFSAASAGTDYYNPGGTDVALGDGGTGASLTDPNADRIMFWDDSAGQVTWLTPGTNLSITGTTLDASGGAGGGDFSSNTATSVDGEIVLFSGTGGKTGKRATQTGILKGASGVVSAAAAGTDYVAPGGALGTPSSGTLTSCTGLPLAGVTDSTSEALGVGTLELGHASDTTVSRPSAGQIAVEGVPVVLIKPTVNSAASGATLTLDAAYGATVRTAQAAAITAVALNGSFSAEQKHMIRIKDDGTSRAITWTASVIVAADDVTLPVATTVGKTHRIGCIYDEVVGKLIAIAEGTY